MSKRGSEAEEIEVSLASATSELSTCSNNATRKEGGTQVEAMSKRR